MAFQPMPLSRRPAPFDHPEWIFELKYDGFRSLAVIESGRTQLISRNGHPFNSFTELRKTMRVPYPGKTVLDGEIVCLNKRGKPQFRDLLFHRGDPWFFAFDLLVNDGKDLRAERLTDRKHELRRLMSKVTESRMRYVEHVEQFGTALFQRVCKLDLESWRSTAMEITLLSGSERRGSKSETLNTHRWKAERNCSSASDTTNLPLAGIVVNWLAQNWSSNMAQFENKLGNCGIEYAAAWSDQGLPCGKPAVARCADCGVSICSDCLMDCCGQSFCGQCYDYHLTHTCLKKPVQSDHPNQERTTETA
jgi:ATP dependent DNA ligase-like protein